MAWYKTGTITVTNGSTTVTGSGTAWVLNAAVGEALYAPDGRLYEITNIASDTAFTIAPAYLGSTAAGQAYVIVPSQSYIRDLAAQAADLVNQYSTIAAFAGQGKFGDGTLSAPGIRYSDDLDTGFFRSDTNEVTFVAGGVAQFKYNASGISFVGGSGIDLTTFSIDGTTVTASGAELNILDGATISTAELNILDGVTATTAELNHTDGVTSNIQTQLDTKAPSADPTFTGDLEYTGTLTGGTGVINIGSGQVYKDASGNLGIGTSSPGAKLTIDGGTSADQLRIGTDPNYYKIGRNSVSGPFEFYGTQSGVTGYVFGGVDGERLRIDSSGNVGIGTSSPAGKFNVGSGRSFFGANSELYSIGLGFTQSRVSSGQVYYVGATDSATPSLVFSNAAGIERARIDDSGNLLVGTTTTGGNGYTFNSNGFLQHARPSGAAQSMTSFYNGGNAVGEIRTSTTATQYLTSSDYRLKEDAQPVLNPINRLMQLKPINFAWKLNGSRTDGFLAHEAQAVVPEAVTGTKDAVDKDGKPKYQGIDQSKLVPLLTAALQDAIKRIEQLESQINSGV